MSALRKSLHKNFIATYYEKWVDNISGEAMQHNLTNFVKIYFDFAYYLGASPFCFRKDTQTQRFYQLHTWPLQQVGCAISHILVIILLISGIRESFPEDLTSLNKNPTGYFQIVLSACTLSYKCVTMKRFWMNREDYLKVVNTIIQSRHLPNTKVKLTSPAFSYLLCTFNVIQVVVVVFGGFHFVSPSWDWSPSWWFRRLIAYGGHMFGFTAKLKNDDVPTVVTAWDAMIALITFFGLFARTIIAFFCDLILLCAALTLWSATSSFANNIQDKLTDQEFDNGDESGLFTKGIIAVRANKDRSNDHREEWKHIFKKFQGIQKLSVAISNALGSQFTWYMAEGLMYYSTNMNSVLVTNDWFRRINLTIFYITTFMILFIAADVCNQLGTIKSWLYTNDNMKNIPSHEATLVLHEMQANDIGIRGSNVFTLTFPLVATYLSLIITFFIICVQHG